jgi:hypothetical protein
MTFFVGALHVKSVVLLNDKAAYTKEEGSPSSSRCV